MKFTKEEKKIFAILLLVTIISTLSAFALGLHWRARCLYGPHFNPVSQENIVPGYEQSEYCKTLRTAWQLLLVPIMLPLLVVDAVPTAIYLGSVYIPAEWIGIPLILVLTIFQLLIVTKILSWLLKKQTKG